MNRAEYMAELQRRLQRLPAEEIKSVIMYYEEYFEDAGVENEQDIIQALGSPAAVAGHLIGEFAMKEPSNGTPPTTKKSMNAIWVALLAIFASPIALPIAIAFAAVILALVITLYAALFSLGVAGFALTLSGVATTIMSLVFIPSGIAVGFIGIGAGLVLFAIGLLLSMLTVLLFRMTFKGIAKLVGSFLIKKNKVKQSMYAKNMERNGVDNENIQ